MWPKEADKVNKGNWQRERRKINNCEWRKIEWLREGKTITKTGDNMIQLKT